MENSVDERNIDNNRYLLSIVIYERYLSDQYNPIKQTILHYNYISNILNTFCSLNKLIYI